jgi:transposase
LDGKQIEWIYRAVTNGNPRQFSFEFALWTRELVRELIRKRFKVKLSLSSISRLLRQLGLTPQKPLFKAYQQNKERIEKWLSVEYPKIKRLAKKEGAKIFFADESGVRSDFHAGTTWAPKGKTPVVEATGARFKVSMISAITAQGFMRFMVVEGTIGAETFVEFLKRFLVGETQPSFLIVDSSRVHRAKVVSKFVASTQGMLRLFFLPGYSPELNPDELVWNDLKNNIVGRQLVSTQKELKSNVVGGLRRIQKDPEKIRTFFAKESTRYAA